ncbi:hypothetical protein E2562_038925 [Oryza meyeriana var. granulata]|uniref:Uncharacterized protein n=1 Tax=Oryza meyeriana var. granulata TaxID=110450 RepID=A0A6G1DVK7_9ORYZ|nr:hypothetical protein E2562_038131 [Oryza meyeriana var. granulata]KAF0915799.1 hypothetical protein E2562_038925 [Oryza meyeriana var. granulata]
MIDASRLQRSNLGLLRPLPCETTRRTNRRLTRGYDAHHLQLNLQLRTTPAAPPQWIKAGPTRTKQWRRQ